MEAGLPGLTRSRPGQLNRAGKDETSKLRMLMFLVLTSKWKIGTRSVHVGILSASEVSKDTPNYTSL